MDPHIQFKLDANVQFESDHKVQFKPDNDVQFGEVKLDPCVQSLKGREVEMRGGWLGGPIWTGLSDLVSRGW